MTALTQDEIAQLIRYLQGKFCNDKLTIKLRDNVKDSAEVMLNGEHIGLIYKVVDEGETSYEFNMSILDFDLTEAA